MSFSVDASQPIWRTAFSETVTNDDLLKLARGIDILENDDRVAPKVLIDLRELSDVDVDFATVRAVVGEVDRHQLPGTAKTGFIARSPVQYGFARTIQMLLYGQPLDIQVFEDKDDALEWVSN
jgi:hypothetical protein